MRYHINKPPTWCDALRRKLSPVSKEMAWNMYKFFSLSLSSSLFLRYCCLPWILFTTHHHNHNAIKRSKYTKMKMKVPENIFFFLSFLHSLSHFYFYILLFLWGVSMARLCTLLLLVLFISHVHKALVQDKFILYIKKIRRKKRNVYINNNKKEWEERGNEGEWRWCICILSSFFIG